MKKDPTLCDPFEGTQSVSLKIKENDHGKYGNCIPSKMFRVLS